DVWMQVTTDGGATFTHVGENFKHVDNHALWIDPSDPSHLIAGCDGGVYETHDRGTTWVYFDNLPITQFYRVTVDTSEPFYFVYGGTQDNATFGGPTRTRNRAGIANEDWFVTVFGDGFETVVDPEQPNIVYSQWQYGGLVRFDRATGETVDIQPQPAPGEDPLRWNWDAPVIISPHSHTRLYFAAQKLFRSDDRGNTWVAISGDLSRGIDRNQLEVMGKVWGPDAVHKSGSTSLYGNAVSLTESPLAEGLIYVGTDDGQVHVTSDGGATWRVEGDFPGVPTYSYVAELEASQHDADTVFATFDNHKQGDFTPYVLKSTDRGRSWRSIRGDLPDREIAWTVAQDHVDPDLIFLGAEFGLYVTVDGGAHWVKMTGGLPTIAVRDLDVQRRENDLALGTFGRGFYILDDYTPLRGLDRTVLEEEAALFPVKDALRYIEISRLGLVPLDKAFQGDTYFTAPNPPFGAVFTYHLADGLTTRQERRIEAEKKAAEAGETLPYPSQAELRAEDEEREPQVVLTVRDAAGDVIQRLTGPRTEGFHRVAWNLRYPSTRPVDPDPGPSEPWDTPRIGPLALPGAYSVTLAKEVDGVVTELAGPQRFEVVDLGGATLPGDDPAAALEFARRAAALQRAVLGAVEVSDEMSDRIDHLRLAVLDTPRADADRLAELAAIESQLNDLLVVLRGDLSKAKRNEPVAPSIVDRVNRVVEGQLGTTQPPTATARDGYRWASAAFSEQLAALHALDDRLAALEAALEADGAPWTPGRFPDWPGAR
ncbi:MAG: glycosyl hydrolase, partial [Holophagae bacterium]